MQKEKSLYKKVMAVPVEKLMDTPLEDLERTIYLLEIEAKHNVSAMLWLKSIIEARLRQQNDR